MPEVNIDTILMRSAMTWANASYCKRSKVGAVIAKDGRIISTGYNGTVPGCDNCCEDQDGNTRHEVSHAEENAILFCARHGLSTQGTSLYTTLSPCRICAKMIATCGIKNVFYLEEYRDTRGLEDLFLYGVECHQIKVETQGDDHE